MGEVSFIDPDDHLFGLYLRVALERSVWIQSESVSFKTLQLNRKLASFNHILLNYSKNAADPSLSSPLNPTPLACITSYPRWSSTI